MEFYFDYNATTPLHPAVKEELKNALDIFGNPSSSHAQGQIAKRHIRIARQKVALMLGVCDDTIVFTSCGSEANNLAIKGAFFSQSERGRHIITTAVEHKSVLETCSYLKNRFNADVTILNVDENGNLDLDVLSKSIRSDTILISAMTVNNETGVIFPINEIGKIAKNHNVLFHTDAIQAFGKIKLNLDYVDMLSFSGHKIYAPKGVGGLYVRDGLKLDPLIHGGGHERYRRAGTENILGIIGLGKACEVSQPEDMEKKIRILRDGFENRILEKIPHAKINGDLKNRIYTTSNISFPSTDADVMMINLDLSGMCVSTGSACTSGVVDSSHVLNAMFCDRKRIISSVRFSFGYFTRPDEVDRLVELITTPSS